MTPPEIRFWAKVKIDPEGCWLWQAGVDRKGYGIFMRKAGEHVMAHRFAYEDKIGKIPDGFWVLHRCDIPGCVRPDHLFLGTHRDNMRDMRQKGRSRTGNEWKTSHTPETIQRGDQHWTRREPGKRLFGQKNPRAKLSAEQVEEIRQLSATGKNRKEIADQYGIHWRHVYRIVNRERWS